MDGITNAILDAAGQAQTAKLAQDVQVSVLKKALDQQGAGMMTLLQSATGPLPLATSGPLGTQVNVLA